MADDEAEKQTFLEKLLFYTTAFFVLLGIFSLFAFLFLVPFVIDPAFTTIFMEFEPRPVHCQTLDNDTFHGLSNCSWASCREGCTKEVFECTQIRVNYKLPWAQLGERGGEMKFAGQDEAVGGFPRDRRSASANGSLIGRSRQIRGPRAVREYGDYQDRDADMDVMYDADLTLPDVTPTGLMGNDSEWYYVGARLFPNVKGCGYPPMLNCTIWLKMYDNPGTNFSCYYSKIDPGVVITELDMAQVYLNLILALAIPIPSFIASVIYLTIAYFKIYNEEEQEVLVNDEEVVDGEGDAGTPVPALTSGGLTPGSEAFREDLASFGHQLKVAMADEMSRESIADTVPTVVTNNSASAGNSVSGLAPLTPATQAPSDDASLNKLSASESTPTPVQPPPAKDAAEKATRPNALDLKLGAFV